jgi:hypothetical protein
MSQNLDLSRSRLTTPRAAAIAGILFSLLLITSLTLIRLSVPQNPEAAGDWLTTGWRTATLALRTGILPRWMAYLGRLAVTPVGTAARPVILSRQDNVT